MQRRRTKQTVPKIRQRSIQPLRTDPSETTNIADEHPEVMKKMHELATNIREDLGDNLTDTEHLGQRTVGIVID